MSDSKAVVGKMEAGSKSVKTSPAVIGMRTSASLSGPEALHQTIAIAAYYLAEGRNFEPGREVEDWLSAEAQVLAEREGLKGFPA